MVVISKAILRDFTNKHPDSTTAIQQWYEITSQADWKHFAEMKDSFNSADSVGNDRYVFNIRGNEYRIVALILFSIRTVFILFVGSHKEYDKIDASKVEFIKK